MTTTDLPPELWFEILSYLPRHFIFKVMGLNRMLFQMAMEYKYEEIRFTTDDKDAMRVFKQLRYVIISLPNGIARGSKPTILPSDTRTSRYSSEACTFDLHSYPQWTTPSRRTRRQ